MKSYKELIEGLVFEGHDRYPGDDMTQKELKIAINAAKNILEMLDDGAELMRWQISAIVKASDELASVCTSMKADEEDDEEEDDEPMYVGFEYPHMYGEEVELDEAIMSSRMNTESIEDINKKELAAIIKLAKEKNGIVSVEAVKYIRSKLNLPVRPAINIWNKIRQEFNEEVELDEAVVKQGSKEHLDKLQGMLDKVKPGSIDHSQIRSAISAIFGDQHIPAKHKNVKPDFYEELDYKVSVDGLPDMYVKANSPAEVKASLRKVIRKPDAIQSVDRVTQTMLKKIFRDKAMGKEDLDEAVHNVVDQIKTSKSPYKKASEALHDSSKTHRREDKWELEMHAKLLSSENPADHKKSAEYVKNLDPTMKKRISNLVHMNSSAEHSAKWHSNAGIKRVNEEAEVDESSFVTKAAHAKVAGDSSFRLKGDEKEYPVTIKTHHARKIKRNIEE